MKKILLILLLFSSFAFSQPSGFVNPLEFDNTDQQRQKVISYIKNGSLHKYCDSEDDACHPNILQLSQSDNLTAFLELSVIQNKEYLERLISEYCNSEFFHCSYENLLKVYEDNLWCDVGIWEMRSVQNSNFKNRQYPTPVKFD